MRHAVTPHRRAVFVALTLLAASTPVGAYRLEDTLRGTTRGNVVGGAVMADGWHVTDRRDRVWYALPRLVSGSAEFTVTGLTMDRLVAKLRAEGVEFRRGSAGGGNQVRQPYLKGIVPADHYKAFPHTEHVHFYGMYIGNFPDLKLEEVDAIVAILNAA